MVKLRPEFGWREVDSVVVIRPVASWDAPTDTLGRIVGPFRSEHTHPHHVLHTMLESTQPGMSLAHADLQLSSLGRRDFDPSAVGVIDRPITVQFAGGPLLNALNAIAEPFHGIWQVGSRQFAGHAAVIPRAISDDWTAQPNKRLLQAPAAAGAAEPHYVRRTPAW